MNRVMCRWTVRVRGALGREKVIVVQARDGQVYAGLGRTSFAFHPAEISSLRAVLADAQAVALQQRGEW